MREEKDALREHRKHFLEPKSEWLKEKLRLFRIKPDELKPLIPICNVQRGHVVIEAARKFDPHLGDLDRYIRTIAPKDLFELKELVGVPNRVLERCGTAAKRCGTRLHELPAHDATSLKGLSSGQRGAMLGMAHDLLYGHADKEQIAKYPYASVVKFMLERSSRLATFTAESLVVCPSEVVEFRNFAAVYITNVVVYGSGTIKLGNNTKLHAYQVKHV